MRLARVFTCVVCDTTFVSRKKDPRFCSKTCIGEARFGNGRGPIDEMSTPAYAGLTRYVLYARPDGLFEVWDTENDSRASLPLGFDACWDLAWRLERRYGTRKVA